MACADYKGLMVMVYIFCYLTRECQLLDFMIGSPTAISTVIAARIKYIYIPSELQLSVIIKWYLCILIVIANEAIAVFSIFKF